MADTEFKLAVRHMRTTIQDAIAGAVGAFQTRTGVTPSAIHIDMTEVTQAGDAARIFVLGGVRFKFDDQ